MLISHEKEKLYNAIIFFIKNTQYCTKTKLMKLLYYLDFLHFKETGKSVTGLKYKAYNFGPYPEVVGSKINNRDPELCGYVDCKKVPGEKEYFTFTPKKVFNDQYFTKREKRILENVAFIFKDVKTEAIVEASHLKNHPWDRTRREKGDKQEIDYLLALDENSPPMEEVLEAISFRKAVEKVCP
jgi:uncharacterized phage-associated protein